jgi:hypothetical protein
MAEQTKATTTKPTAARPGDPAAERLGALRAIAKGDGARAQEEAWAWIEELGAKRDGDGLAALFALGTAPGGLNGPTDGILVTTLANPVIDAPLRMLTSVWMPWQGKTFDAANARGVNRMTASSRLPAKLLWPTYGMRVADDGRIAFDFETAVEPGAIDPPIDVLKIDYGPFEDNPDVIIRQIRDELVELVPDTYLGRILFKLRGKFSNIGYFALRQPPGTAAA